MRSSRSGKIRARVLGFAAAAALVCGSAAGAAQAASQNAAPPSQTAVPTMYTAAQATAGNGQYQTHCAVCHGVTLAGQAGPALKGAAFAPSKQRPTVGDMFRFMSSMMPAPQPGSLAHKDYVEIMAYLLEQNGYPAGSKALTYEAATKSKAALAYHGK